MVTKTMRLLIAVPMLLGAYFAINIYAKTATSQEFPNDDADRFSQCVVLSGEGYFNPGQEQSSHFKVNVVKDRYDQVTGYLKYLQQGREVTLKLTCLQVEGNKATVSGKASNGQTIRFQFIDYNEKEDAQPDQVSAPAEESACASTQMPSYFAISEGRIRIDKSEPYLSINK